MLNFLAGLGSNHMRRDEIIDKAIAFKMGHVVERFRRQKEVSEPQALEFERELKRYLAMCAIYPRITFPMEGPVDELWHVFLAHTAAYRRSCDSVAGRIIHHWPAGSPKHRGARRADYETFVRIYERLFGDLPSSNLWPFAKAWRDRQGHGPALVAATAAAARAHLPNPGSPRTPTAVAMAAATVEAEVAAGVEIEPAIIVAELPHFPKNMPGHDFATPAPGGAW